MPHDENPLNGVFNQAETSMGTDMYQANVERMNADSKHCTAQATHLESKAKVSTAYSVLLGTIALTSLGSAPAVIIAVWRWGLGL